MMMQLTVQSVFVFKAPVSRRSVCPSAPVSLVRLCKEKSADPPRPRPRRLVSVSGHVSEYHVTRLRCGVRAVLVTGPPAALLSYADRPTGVFAAVRVRPF